VSLWACREHGLRAFPPCCPNARMATAADFGPILQPPYRLWVDDERPAPPGWAQAFTASGAIGLIQAGRVCELSLDHDLGPPSAGTGYDVAAFVESEASAGRLPRLVWHVHSANPVGRERMRAALESAERFWLEREKVG
jgi:hypothetical protein